ncbi:MAG TPA: TonB-dependent receptor [Rhizomicrobium sp.]|jgi:outer membrane receptor protein involved in Fe transport
MKKSAFFASSAVIAIAASAAFALPLAASMLLASPAQAEEASNAGDAGIATEEVVVTGTHISQAGYTAPTPVTVVDQAQIRNSGVTNVIDTLLKMPAIAAGQDANNGANTTDGGASFINLRGLGTNRSLVLVNGRRRVSGSSTSSAVDLNTIPAAMIDHAEITTGGASAIYGADAVSGVLNLITKKNFEGLEMTAQGGISQRGDSENYALSAFGGTSFSNNRGFVGFAVSYSKENPLNYSDRSYLNTHLAEQSNPASKTPTDGIPDRLTYQNVQSLAYSPNVLFFAKNVPYTYGANGLLNVTPTTSFATGPTGNGVGSPGEFEQSMLNARLGNQVTSMRSDLSYKVFDGIKFFAEGEFTQTNTPVPDQYYRFDSRALWFNATGGPIIQPDNYYLPASVKALMASSGMTTLPVAKDMVDELGIITDYHNRNTYSIVTGFEGILFDNWKWDVSYQYGQERDDIETPNLLRGQNFKNALDVIADPASGLPECRSATARAAGCVPYNIFVRGPLSQAQRDYFVATRVQNTENTQGIVGAHLNGDLFELPAGSLAIAAGVEHREEGLHTRDDSGMLSGDIRWGVGTTANARPNLDKKFTVTEEYAEILAPVVRDIPFVQALNVDGAIRASDYNTIGSTIAWAGGVNWTVNDDVRMRFTLSQSVRAPNLLELYGPVTVTLTSAPNPCGSSAINTTANRKANCIALGAPAAGSVNTAPQIESITGGNADLKQELSNSWTLGTVLTPSFLPGFQSSIDFFNIAISGAVTTPNVENGCLDAANMQGNAFCNRMTFSSGGVLLTEDRSLINAAKLTTQGVDFSADYRFQVWGADTVGLNLTGTYLMGLETLAQANDPSTTAVYGGAYTNPRVRLNATVSYEEQNWGGSVTNRFVSSSIIDRAALPEARVSNTVPSIIYTDATVHYTINDNLSGFVGINNLFDFAPPQRAQTYNYGDLYDLTGRFFHGGITAKF